MSHVGVGGLSDHEAGRRASMTLGPGKSFPLGASLGHGGVNFSVFSDRAEAIELLLFDRVDDAQPSRVIALDPRRNRTDHYWRVFVPGLGPGQLYGYRAVGAFDPARGLRFDRDKVLLDPYGRAVAVPPGFSRLAACQPGDTAATAMKSVVTDPWAYAWEGDAPLHLPIARTVIYELHIGGFTRHPSSGVAAGRRGARNAAITTPIARTTSSPGSTGPRSTALPISTASPGSGSSTPRDRPATTSRNGRPPRRRPARPTRSNPVLWSSSSPGAR
jgi:pullulanase/glycogen debranching enzyme